MTTLFTTGTNFIEICILRTTKITNDQSGWGGSIRPPTPVVWTIRNSVLFRHEVHHRFSSQEVQLPDLQKQEPSSFQPQQQMAI